MLWFVISMPPHPFLPSNRRRESLHERERERKRERERAISKVVFKLLEVDFIKEVYYSDWLANVVMV